MTIEEAKRRAELYSAVANGKTIQVLISSGEWKDVKINELTCISENISFRIKPEPKYRPFKTKEECWSEMLKHQPFGWVIGGKGYENFYHIEYVYSCNPYNYHRVKLSQNDMSFNYEHMFRDFTFIDGSPFGMKDE